MSTISASIHNEEAATDEDADSAATVHQHASRRTFLASSSSTLLLLPLNHKEALAVEAPQAVRPTVYRVDSTIPPTLQAVPTARGQTRLLNELGRGSGTPKALTEALNLNNILNRAVFGSIQTVQDIVSPSANAVTASFVCLGISQQNEDTMRLATFIAESISRRAKRSNPESVAIGVTVLPFGCQEYLDRYINDASFGIDPLLASLSDQLSKDVLEQYKALFIMAKSSSVRLLAMGLPNADSDTVLKGGLQSLEAEKRSQYVMDPNGFIAQTNDPKFKLYTDRVLLRNATSTNTGNYFAERILAHEAAATAAVRFVTQTPAPRLLTIVAPTEDLRYLGGINGRLPRVYNSVASSDDAITDDDVTTILLNPTAASTLSMTRRIRLEIGTGPDTLQYQTKVADYIWFSSSPPVNLLHRVMDY